MVKYSTNLFLLFLFISYSLTIYSQEKEDLKFIMRVNPIGSSKIKKSHPLLKRTSEVKMFFGGIIGFYQFFISSQDKPSCNFTISCSDFSLAAINEYGFFYGLLMTSDRLQRCNGFGKIYYQTDSFSKLSIDYPIQDFYLKKTLSDDK
jgi:putative component of membrane protein insertase Oxa1/YidC/SpoIIIJ protein YidD